MNVYDFDGTIYRGDSSIDFYVFCLLRYPWLVICIPYQISMILAYKLHLCSKEQEKSAFFSFLRLVPNVQSTVKKFWSKNIKKITSWYLAQKQDDDVIISASPTFLLHPACNKLGVGRLLASDVNPLTGQFHGKNCYGIEKIYRFTETFTNDNIDSFYSDSDSDTPMAKLAQMAFKVKKAHNITRWKTK